LKTKPLIIAIKFRDFEDEPGKKSDQT